MLRLKKIFLTGIFLAFTCNFLNAQIPTTDIIVVLEEVLGLSMEGTELYQKYNDIKTQIAQIEQNMEGNAELQRAAELIRQYNDLLQGSKLNDFSKLLQLTENFKEFGSSGGLNDFLDLGGSSIDASSLVQALSTSDFSDLSYSDAISGYQDINSFVETVSQDNRQMKMQTALTYLQLSKEYKNKAIELDMLLNGTTERSFTADGSNLGFSEMTGIFESIKSILPGSGMLSELASSGFGLKNLFTLGNQIKNGITNMFTNDPDFDDFTEAEQAEILEQYQEYDYDDNGILDEEEYAAIVESMSQNLEDEMEAKTQAMSSLFDNITAGISGVSSTIGSLTIAGEEAALVATDAERIEMMKLRDDYIAISIEYQDKCSTLMTEATTLSPMETEQRNANIVKNVSTGLSSAGKIESSSYFFWQ